MECEFGYVGVRNLIEENGCRGKGGRFCNFCMGQEFLWQSTTEENEAKL